MHFWVIPIDFQLEKYIPFKDLDVSIFSCSINVTVTSQKDVPFFSYESNSLYLLVLYTPKFFAFSVVYCVDVVENVYRRTKVKIDSI